MGGTCGGCGNACSRDSEQNVVDTQPSEHCLPDSALMKTKRRRGYTSEYRRALSQERFLLQGLTSPMTSMGETASEATGIDTEPPTPLCKDDENMMASSDSESESCRGKSRQELAQDHSGSLFRADTTSKWNHDQLEAHQDEMEGAMLRLMKKSSAPRDYLFSDHSSTSSISVLSIHRSKSSTPTVNTRAEVMNNAKRSRMSPNAKGRKMLKMESTGYESKSGSSASTLEDS